MGSSASITGRRRRARTRLSVRLSDATARYVITVGGIGTIVALFLIFAELGSEVAPLLSSADLENQRLQPSPWRADDAGVNALTAPVVGVRVDEYRTMSWMLRADGLLEVRRLDTGELLDARRLIEAGTIHCFSDAMASADVALGMSDGTIRLGEIAFATEFLNRDAVPESLGGLGTGQLATWDGDLLQRTPQGQFRRQRVSASLSEPLPLGSDPVEFVDHISPRAGGGRFGGQVHRVVAYSDGPGLQLCAITAQENRLTGEMRWTTDSREIPLPESPDGSRLLRVFLLGRGDNVACLYEDGVLLRFDVGRPRAVRLVERLDLLVEPEARVTACELLLMRETLLCGSNQGDLTGWMRTRRQEADIGDGFRLSAAHLLPPGRAAVSALGPSARSRMVAVGYTDGTLRVMHVTTETLVCQTQVDRGRPILTTKIAPRDDGLLAATSEQVWTADFDPAHPEATWASLFRPVWYENYSVPQHMWQSSAATQGPEMKLGMWPLIFGTLKATLYTMLFGTPLALLAAVYTSEFMQPTLRAAVKPTIEMMASLPSVVLGFLAALVFAPLVERHLAQTLSLFATIPLCFLTAAHLWQLLPQPRQAMLARYRPMVMLTVLPLGLLLAWLIGPWVTWGLFAGDVMGWLDGQVGSGLGAWLFLWLPLAALSVLLLTSWFVNPWLRRRAGRWTRRQFAMMGLAKFIVGAVAAGLLAYGTSWALTAVGWDPRGSYVDTYVHRNALVVGFVMGFAVVPIIYTLAEDSLATVPQHLRSASLGCGATQWQTAVRIVIPTAMSGLFSAIMIGLGRAVGETMIVLMAGGNTPVMEWNVFNGFRSLAANIAVELPEAVKDSTHYRTLFLAALTLLVFTFFINTVAEMVRLRFRKRAYQL